MELQNTLRDLFNGRRQPNVRLGAVENIIQNEPQEVVEIIDPAILPDVPALEEQDKEPEDTCTVCLEELTAENTHELRCGHRAVCKDCHPMMMTQNIGNGCVGEDPETCVKVIKCPICRREDMPTREQLIAEIVRMRRGGYIRPLPRVPAPLPAVIGVQVPQHHNLPAVIPVLHPQPALIDPAIALANFQHAVRGMGGAVRAPRARAPRAPRVAPVAQEPAININAGIFNVADGNWLRNQNFIPRRANGLDNEHERNHLPQHYPIDDIARWNILSGHQIGDAQAVGAYLNAGQRVAGGFVCGEAGRRRFYHAQFFIPENTEGNVPSRRLCNNANCDGNHRSRTARRCPKGCGQFICQACTHCHTNECRTPLY